MPRLRGISAINRPHTQAPVAVAGRATPAVALCLVLTITRAVDSSASAGNNATNIVCQPWTLACSDEGSTTQCSWIQVCLQSGLRAAQCEYLSAHRARSPCARFLPRIASAVPFLTNAFTSPPEPRKDSICRRSRCVTPASCTIYQVCVSVRVCERSVIPVHDVYVSSHRNNTRSLSGRKGGGTLLRAS